MLKTALIFGVIALGLLIASKIVTKHADKKLEQKELNEKNKSSDNPEKTKDIQL